MYYSLRDLPPGVAYNGATFSGAATAPAVGQATLTYTATDANGGTDSLTFTLTVNPPPRFEAAAAIGVQIWTVGVTPAFPMGVFPVVSGGSAPLSYSMTNLPAGVSYDGATSTFSGAADRPVSATVIYTVTDANGGTDRLPFDVMVRAVPTLPIINAPPPWTVGAPIPVLTLPPADGTLPPADDDVALLSYHLDLTAVPDLTFNPLTLELSGTPAKSTTGTALSYTVIDANGATATRTFTVIINSAPGFAGTAAIEPLAWTVGIPPSVPAARFPVATGGSGGLRYGMTGLPAGVTYNGAAFSGVATAAESVTATYTVADANGIADSRLTFTVTVSAVSVLPEINNPPAWTVGAAIANLTLPEATGGIAPLSYRLNPQLPGLTFNPLSLELSGRPTTPTIAAGTVLNYTVVDANGAIATRTFTVVMNSAPTFGTNLIAPQNWTSGVTPRVPAGGFLKASGGSAPLSYSMTNLPLGVSYDGRTSTFSGIAGEPVSVIATYWVVDANGVTDRAYVAITVHPNTTVPPELTLAEIDNPPPWTRGTAIPVLTLPDAEGGVGPFSYRLSPQLGGLIFNPNPLSRKLSGTPTRSTTGTVMTYTVEDANGAIATRSFVVAIVPNSSYGLNFSGTRIPDQSYIAGNPDRRPDTAGSHRWRRRSLAVALPPVHRVGRQIESAGLCTSRRVAF